MGAGSFSGNPKTEWLAEAGPDRRMKILETFWYEDPGGTQWTAPQGSIVDGASIPEALWSAVGSPYTGDYRRASIVHDVACSNAAIPREQSDEMFFYACIAGGCSTLQAKLLYAGVRIGAWAGEVAPDMAFAPPGAPPVSGQRLPNQHSPAELMQRAKFTLVAQRLAQTPDDFASVKQAVDDELNRKP